MVLSNIPHNGRSSPRYVIINEETYVEMPTTDLNAVHNGAILQHLIPIKEIYNTSRTYDREKKSVNSSYVPGSKRNVSNSSSRSENMISFDDTASDDDEGALFIDCDVSENEVEAAIESPKKEENNGDNNQEIVLRRCLNQENSDQILTTIRTDEYVVGDIEAHKKIDNMVKEQEKIINGPVPWYTNTGQLKIRLNDDFPIVKLKAKSKVNKSNSGNKVKRRPKTLDCPYCSFKLGGNVLRHLLFHMRKYFCRVHDQVFSLKEACLYIRDKSSQILGCMKCSYRGKNEKHIVEHVMAAHKNLFYSQCAQCGYCPKQTQNGSLTLNILKKHVEKKHGKKMSFSPWFSLIQTSVQESVNIEEHRCPHCPDKVLYNLADYKDHLIQHHQTNKFLKCDLCEFTNCSKNRMEFHKNMHLRDLRKFKCPYCEYKNSKHFMLKYHIRDKHRRDFENKITD